MNSSLVCIGILVKSNISRHCLIKFLTEVSSSALRRYLGAAEVYDYMMVMLIKKRVT